jgi:hypothetical protein
VYTAADLAVGSLVANAARGTGWVARGARALLKAQAAWDRLQQVRDLADLAIALEGMREQIAEFLAHAEADGYDEDRAVEVLTDLVYDRVNSGNCLPAGTPVRTERGLRPIEKVAAGDMVLSLNPRTGAWELRRVTAAFEHFHLGTMVQLTVAGETLEATADHPFFVTAGEGLYERPAPSHHTTAEEPFSRLGGRWVAAKELRVGDEVVTLAGRARVEAVSLRESAEPVYNIEVEGTHTFAVGEVGVGVHNRLLKKRISRNELHYTLKSQGRRPRRTPGDVAWGNNHPIPTAARGSGTIGTSGLQASALSADAASARARGFGDIRVNQQHVNSAGRRVGRNRPDLQYTENGIGPNGGIAGRRVYIEYERPGYRTRGESHARRILANDPTALVIVKFIP